MVKKASRSQSPDASKLDGTPDFRWRFLLLKTSGLATGLLVLLACSDTTVVNQVGAQLFFSVEVAEAETGSLITPPVEVTIQDALGNTVTHTTQEVSLSVGNNPGGGTLFGTTTTSADNGVAVFDEIWIDSEGAGYTLIAEAGSLTPVTSQSFDVLDPPILLGAGDIASCTSDGDEATAALLDQISGTVFTAGDNVYPDGTAEEFANCYDSSWGRHLDRTRPAPGNHDFHTPEAAGYFEYFGERAGDPPQGYYSYDLAAWHVVVLNSMIDNFDDSPQLQWLEADLAASTKSCTLAYWHYPRFSSGRHGNVRPLVRAWRVLYDAGAELVISGHDHVYERFAKQTPDGVADPERGIRQFVVGTGGSNLYSFDVIQPNSEVRDNTAYGVLKLTLRRTGYDWEFVPVAGQDFTDSGSDVCH